MIFNKTAKARNNVYSVVKISAVHVFSHTPKSSSGQVGFYFSVMHWSTKNKAQLMALSESMISINGMMTSVLPTF